jgi:hypothetical protein
LGKPSHLYAGLSRNADLATVDHEHGVVAGVVEDDASLGLGDFRGGRVRFTHVFGCGAFGAGQKVSAQGVAVGVLTNLFKLLFEQNQQFFV